MLLGPLPFGPLLIGPALGWIESGASESARMPTPLLGGRRRRTDVFSCSSMSSARDGRSRAAAWGLLMLRASGGERGWGTGWRGETPWGKRDRLDADFEPALPRVVRLAPPRGRTLLEDSMLDDWLMADFDARCAVEFTP